MLDGTALVMRRRKPTWVEIPPPAPALMDQWRSVKRDRLQSGLSGVKIPPGPPKNLMGSRVAA